MSFAYMASPYSDPDPAVKEWRYRAALKAAAHLMARGWVVFSPIAHTHPIDPYVPRELASQHGFWMAQDVPLLRHARRLVVLKLPGWESSRGIAEEIAVAQAARIPVEYMEPV